MEERTVKKEYQNHVVDNKLEFYDDDEDSYSSDYSEDDDVDELYLKPGEPFGTVLQSPEKPYNRRQRVEELNVELSVTRPGSRTLPIRVKFKDELLHFVNEDIPVWKTNNQENDSEQDEKLTKNSVSTMYSSQNSNIVSYNRHEEHNWESTTIEENRKRNQSGSESTHKS